MRAALSTIRVMTKDFAGRSQRARSSKKHVHKRKAPTAARTFFHGPSFTAGALVGAAIVILAAYGPDYLAKANVAENVDQGQTEAAPTLQFDFPDMLKDMEVLADPEPYAVPSTTNTSGQKIWHIQAASFRDKADADALRARLLLENLPATTSASEANGSNWHRVVLGPFKRQVDANRAMTRLREQGISGMWLNNHN